jgi:lipoprotein NlpI
MGATNLTPDYELAFVADHKMRDEDVRGAIQDCTQALAANPDNAHAYFTRGCARAEEGDSDGAVDDLSECIRLDPTRAPAYFNRGIIMGRKGDYLRSIADCNQGLDLDPQNAFAYFVRGVDWQILGDFAKAAADYQKSIDLHCANSDYAQIYRDSAQTRLPPARDPLQHTQPDWKDSWAKSLDEFVAGTMDEATLLDLVKKPQRTSASGLECQAFYFIGERHLAQGDPAGARSFFGKCLATDQTTYNEYQFARAELVRLDAPLGNQDK